MSNSLMYSEDHFVVLEVNQPEVILTRAELLTKLESILSQHQDNLPRDLQKYSTVTQQAQYLLDTCCEFDLSPGKYLQWYAIRLEK
ncbi:MAG: chlororespiratory reduction protein 7 [Microcoleaceae cyanobacterium]